ncbi:uncharacterized protein L3040_007137 [Drepanopeziza brunnea f. sp. 'multigermtubi']|uniref:uncharacterized protein n=1 Tax=Drepanopeziza brunnea f. sp. 'multigermtubi' TaxID=698441 RepID=UPI002386FAFF|nr:hypothetical protein L3040_007137 [Drepanopeziza brunnea f. sp. 'multigermtubi']
MRFSLAALVAFSALATAIPLASPGSAASLEEKRQATGFCAPAWLCGTSEKKRAEVPKVRSVEEKRQAPTL